MSIESNSEKFDLDLYFAAQEKTKKAVFDASLKIKPGMTENEALQVLNFELANIGVVKFWHPTKFRIGHNTTKSFKDISDHITLEENDIFFIDVGPVLFDHEADFGETFTVGYDPRFLALKEAPKNIFLKTQAEWKKSKLTGIELYKFAELEANKLKLTLNTKMYGHRLGDFPHALHYKGNLGGQDIIPAPNLWVLEIHLIDEELNRGAFFEDILT